MFGILVLGIGKGTFTNSVGKVSRRETPCLRKVYRQVDISSWFRLF